MTKQEIFDRVCEHAAKQKTRSIDANGDCCYRTQDGKACFVGALIPDEEYDPEMDNGGTLLTEIVDTLGWSPDMTLFFDDLQYAHDASIDVEDIHGTLGHVAKAHKLNPAKIALIKEWS